jgi:hypothetical protein
MDPLKSAITEVLKRRPWLTAREIAVELKKEGLSDASRQAVNHHLYQARALFRADGSMPPRWRSTATLDVQDFEEELPILEVRD